MAIDSYACSSDPLCCYSLRETQVTQNLMITNTVRNLSFYSYTVHVNHQAHADEQSI